MSSVIPTPLIKSSKPLFLLIPWDTASPEHVQRLVQQRIACGWDYDAVEEWKRRHESGNLNLQWIVSTLPHFPSHFRNSDFPRSSKTLIPRKLPNYSSILRRIPKNKNRCSIQQFPLGRNHELFPCRRELSSQLDISAWAMYPPST
jgi:hypothetical protein